MLRAVWCRRCRLAWWATVADSLDAPVTPSAGPVRCPRCRCPRQVRLAGDDESRFRRDHPDVCWSLTVRTEQPGESF